MSDQNDLAKFAADVEKAFLLVSGADSKATYDWMIAAQERERIISILEAERDNWVKTGVFNYKLALTNLIERIKE